MTTPRSIGAAAVSLALAGCNLLVPIGDHELVPPEMADGGGVDPTASADASAPDAGPAALAGASVTLATGQSGPRGLAVNATHVYWVNADGGEVARIPKEGGAVQIMTTGQTTPLDVAVDGGRVYWFNLGTTRASVLRAMPLSGGTPTAMADLDGSTFRRMTTDVLNVWVSVDTSVERVPKTGTYTKTAFPGNIGAMASDGSTLYAAHGNNILAAPGGTNPVLFATGGAAPVDLAVDDTSVYWITASGELLKADKATAAGGAGAPIGSGISGAARLALFGSDAFITAAGAAAGTGKVVRVPKAGGTVEVLASELAEPFGVAVDASGVYWTQYGDGTLKKLAFAR